MKDFFIGFAGLIIMLIVCVLFAGGGLIWRYFTAPINKQIEHKVLMESHQFKQGQNQRIATLQANLIEVETLLMSDPNNPNLKAQAAMLRAQINAAY